MMILKDSLLTLLRIFEVLLHLRCIYAWNKEFLSVKIIKRIPNVGVINFSYGHILFDLQLANFT